MTNERNFIEYVTDQIDDDCAITWRMMFGGCTVYSKGKVVALICDDQLFVKPTQTGRTFIGNVVEAPPYTGAKNFFLIDDKIEHGDWLSELIALTERELPAPKPKKKRKKKAGS
jgi:TfoX/Sxy family transcriptional regulator of competence genes